MKHLVILAGIVGAGGCVIGDGTEADPVVFEVGTPQPVAFLPGVVEHEVCVATNVDYGYVRASDFIGIPDVEFIGPSEGAPVQVLPLDGLECPPASQGFRGWARIRWQTQSGRNLVTFEHDAGPFTGASSDTGGFDEEFKRAEKGTEPAAATRGELVLDGEAFPGYEVVDSFVDDSNEGVLAVVVGLEYGDVDGLFDQPAADVGFALSYSPVDVPLFGSSSGFDLKADRTGYSTLLYNTSAFCSSAFDPGTGEPTNVTVFVTPFGGGTALAGTLEFDSYCFFE